MIKGDRPDCVRGCSGKVHRHGGYSRYLLGSILSIFFVQRFLCPHCGLTISVLPAQRVPYRPLVGSRLEAHFNQQAELGSGPDPPPALLEAGCLRRAWTRLQTRVADLKEAFGLLITSDPKTAAALWKQMRLAKGTLEGILLYLAQSLKGSLLADYQCLRLPG
jgi:hypothetical protein